MGHQRHEVLEGLRNAIRTAISGDDDLAHYERAVDALLSYTAAYFGLGSSHPAPGRHVSLDIRPEHQERAARFMRMHRRDFDTSEALDLLADEFQAVANDAYRDGAASAAASNATLDRLSKELSDAVGLANTRARIITQQAITDEQVRKERDTAQAMLRAHDYPCRVCGSQTPDDDHVPGCAWKAAQGNSMEADKWFVIDIVNGRVMGRRLTQAEAQEHANYLNANRAGPEPKPQFVARYSGMCDFCGNFEKVAASRFCGHVCRARHARRETPAP